MSSARTFWARAFVLRSDELDVDVEVECRTPDAAREQARHFWSRGRYDRVSATVDEIGPGGKHRAVAILQVYGSGEEPPEGS